MRRRPAVAVGGGVTMIFVIFCALGSIMACPAAPTWEGQKVACSSDAICESRFGGSAAQGERWFCTDEGFCAPGGTLPLTCASAADCPLPGQAGADCNGTWSCEGGVCLLACKGCEDGDGDGYGVGAGCLGLDCDDGDVTVTDRQTLPCFEGPPELVGVGVCKEGMKTCSGGAWAPACEGQVLPSSELPDLLDDDCDGVTDNVDLAVLPTCVFVAPGGDDANAGTDPAAALATVGRAMEVADAQVQAGNPLPICLAGGASCADPIWSYEAGRAGVPLQMIDGVSIVGSYESTTWTPCPDLTTRLISQDPASVVAGLGLHAPAALARTIVRRTVPGQTGIALRNTKNLTLFDLRVESEAQSESRSVGIRIEQGSRVVGAQIAVLGGYGLKQSIGISVVSSRLELSDSCARDPGSGRCTTCIASPANGIHAADPSVLPDEAIGIELEDARASRIDEVAICDTQAILGRGLKVAGRADKVEISRSSIEATEATFSAIGVLLACADDAPLLIDNEEILGIVAGGGSRSNAFGVFAGDTCHPRIEGNRHISGRTRVGTTEVTAGVHCDGKGVGAASLCVVVDNVMIVGDDRGTAPLGGAGLICAPGACATVENNTIRGGGSGVRGLLVNGLVLLEGSAPWVARNVIEGGCVKPDWIDANAQWSAGVFADDSDARLENNVIYGGSCRTLGGASVGIVLTGTDPAFETDINGNTVDGGGRNNDLGVGVVLVADPLAPDTLGVFRNNLLRPGRGSEAAAFAVLGGRFRLADHNVVWRSGATHVLGLDISVDPPLPLADLGPLIAAIGHDQGTLIDAAASCLQRPDSLPLDPHIKPGSACDGAGTVQGQPRDDFDGDARPSGLPDVGADEI